MSKIKNTSDFWAFLTIMAFPIAVLATTAMGVPHLQAFFWGMLSSVAALFANSMVERRLWMFDPKWKEKFERPDFSFRLAVTTGAILLLLESAALVMLFSGNVERNLMGIVFERSCRHADTQQVELCSVLSRALTRSAR